MKVLERTPTRLSLRLGATGLAAAVCTFDRDEGTAVLRKNFFLIPMPKTALRLDEIAGVETVHQESESSEMWYPQLKLASGRTLPLAGYGRKAADQATQLIAEFLAGR